MTQGRENHKVYDRTKPKAPKPMWRINVCTRLRGSGHGASRLRPTGVARTEIGSAQIGEI